MRTGYLGTGPLRRITDPRGFWLVVRAGLFAMDIREHFSEQEGLHPVYRGESFVALFGCVRCKVERRWDGKVWFWSACGWVITRSGEAKSKRAAMYAARNAVEGIMAIR